MKCSRITLVLALLVIACTAFIFSNSLKDSAASHADSDGIVKAVEWVAERIAPNNKLNWNYIVRKCAHLFEFFLLGLSATSLAFRMKACRRKILIGCFAYTFLVACSDEFIQNFTGRSSRVADVFIDLIGATIGILSIVLTDTLVQSMLLKRKQE